MRTPKFIQTVYEEWNAVGDPTVWDDVQHVLMIYEYGSCVLFDGQTGACPSEIGNLFSAPPSFAFTFNAVGATIGLASEDLPPANIGYPDFIYGTGDPGPTKPTAEKPESKLWWNDGSWWGCLWDLSAATYRIQEFDVETQAWTSVGPDADSRPLTRCDVLWDGGLLYILSHAVVDSSTQATKLFSYTYDSGVYSPRTGFPVNVSTTGSTTGEGTEALTIAKDSTGQLWITWEADSIYVNRTLAGDNDWGTPFVLPGGASNVHGDDISGVVHFGGNKIGIMWSNQADDAMYFAVHNDSDPDNVWQAPDTVLAGTDMADDHINLALTCDSGGIVYAATKTGATGGDKPEIILSRRDPSGNWMDYTVSVVRDGWTRPIVVIDEENRDLYVFASRKEGIRDIRKKVSDLDDISFPPGIGDPFIRNTTANSINDPTSTKQLVNNTTGLLVLASDQPDSLYLHNYISLPPSPPDPPSWRLLTSAAHGVGHALGFEESAMAPAGSCGQPPLNHTMNVGLYDLMRSPSAPGIEGVPSYHPSALASPLLGLPIVTVTSTDEDSTLRIPNVFAPNGALYQVGSSDQYFLLANYEPAATAKAWDDLYDEGLLIWHAWPGRDHPNDDYDGVMDLESADESDSLEQDWCFVGSEKDFFGRSGSGVPTEFTGDTTPNTNFYDSSGFTLSQPYCSDVEFRNITRDNGDMLVTVSWLRQPVLSPNGGQFFAPGGAGYGRLDVERNAAILHPRCRRLPLEA